MEHRLNATYTIDMDVIDPEAGSGLVEHFKNEIDKEIIRMMMEKEENG